MGPAQGFDVAPLVALVVKGIAQVYPGIGEERLEQNGDAMAALRRGQVIQVAIGIAKVEMANRERVDGKGIEMGFKG